MKQHLFILTFVVSVMVAVSAVAQTSADPNEGLLLSPGPASGTYTLSWWGRRGFTYFVQASEDLVTWTYLQHIETGTDEPIIWGYSPTSPTFFLRLRYVNIPTNDPFDVDFDGDGVSNWDELLQGTDPLVKLLDPVNNLPLDWEKFYGVAQGTPANSYYDGDGLTLLQKYQQGLAPGTKNNPILQLVVTVVAQ